ncbi:hypothetical protein J3F83DRAFT_221923 [Trichoderma novae-zelandiae]
MPLITTNGINSTSNGAEINAMVRDIGQLSINIEKIKTTWAEAVRNNDNEFATHLKKKVGDLFDKITAALEEAKAANTTAPTVAAIEDFLFEGDKKKKHIDECILWLLLWWAAGMEPDSAKKSEADKVVFGMIIKRNPYLAFDNPYDSKLSFKEPGAYKSIRDRCPISAGEWKEWRRDHHFQSKVKTTPFHRAAEHGNFAIIRLMRGSLASIAEANHGPIYALITGGDPARPKTTALQHAVDAEHGSVETLGELLAFPCLAESPQLDAIFASAVEDGAVNVINAFLEQDNLKERFVKSKHILAAIKRVPEVDAYKKQQYMTIINQLIRLAVSTEPLTDEVVESIIEQQAMTERNPHEEVEVEQTQLGWMHIWRAVQERPRGVLGDIEAKLLHLAVYHQSPAFVTEFLQHPIYSASVTVPTALPKSSNRNGAPTKQEYYPLWYNSKVWDDKDSVWSDRDGSPKIRTMLVSSTIRQTNKMRKLSDVFYKSGQPVRELCFDMSRFDSKLHRVSEFVDSLTHHAGNETLLSYEETIRYVEFPPLDLKIDDRETFTDNKYLPTRHTEVFDTLTWLREQKGVKQIVELKVPDRLINAHDEKRIAEYVEMFEVECLDWRCLDLSLSVLGSPVAGSMNGGTKANDKIKELHLYSSGRRAVIQHWLGDDGIPTLTKETVTEEYCKEIIDFIYDGLKAIKDRYRKKPTCKFKLRHGTVDSVFWNPTHTLVDLNEIAHRVTPRLAKFLKSLGDYVPEREERTGQKLRQTRVAIIDNGILSITPRPYDRAGRQNRDTIEDGASIKTPGTKGSFDFSGSREKGTATVLDDDQKHETSRRKSLWSSIKAGRSFVDDGSKIYPWMLASDSHGTQMANLICAMDPFCELYVARVAEGKYGITPERTTRAIEWALEKQVDIISMSIALLDQGSNMEHWVNKAKEKGVIIVCSTHDEGTRSPTSYPAEWKPGLVITACDEYGRLLHTINDSKYDYMVQGQNVAAGAIPFVDSVDYLTGSSVSTALVAGLSSLILTCHKLSNLEDTQPETNSVTLESPGKFPYAEGQLEKVKEHLDRMVTKDTKHVVLERFGKIDSTTKEGDEIYASKVLHESFGMRV